MCQDQQLIRLQPALSTHTQVRPLRRRPLTDLRENIPVRPLRRQGSSRARLRLQV